FWSFAPRLYLAIPFGATLAVGLGTALHGHRVVRHVAGNHRARADIGSLADLDGRDQRRIGADECALTDLGLVLAKAVIIARDGTGSDIGVGTDMGITDIAEMIDLHPGLERSRLRLDEIAYLCALTKRGSRPQARKGPDQSVLADRRLHDVTEGMDDCSIRNRNAGADD